MVTDGHDGLLAAMNTLFTATLRQRCLIHKQRNVLNAIPHRERKKLARKETRSFLWREDLASFAH